MAILGDLDHVKQMLRADETQDLGADVDDRLERIQLLVTSALEERTGRTFGGPVADTTVVIYAGASSVLLLPSPARAITSVTVGGTLAGGVYTGGTTYTSSYWVHDPVGNGLIYGLRLLSGGWWGWQDAFNRPITPIKVIGDFSSTDDDVVIPEDVQYVADYLISERFKVESASPAGFLGPDGAVVPVRDAWADPLVKAVINKYGRATKALVF